MKVLKTLKYFVFAAAVSALWVGCEDDNSTQTTSVKVHMTDAPGNFEKVNVDLKGVEFQMDNQTTVNLDVRPGVYNLLDLVNGIDTLIASDEVPSGTLTQVRLVLGDDNTVVVDGVEYPLATPSAQQSGLKLNMNTILVPGGNFDLLLDFDAHQSVILTGNGTYQLKPVLRVIDAALTGSIHGSIATTLALPALVSVTNGSVTYTTITDEDGHFLIRGLQTGIFAVTVTPELPFLPIVLADVNVTVGVVTELTVLTF